MRRDILSAHRSFCFAAAVLALGCSLVTGVSSTATPEPTPTTEPTSAPDAKPSAEPQEPTVEEGPAQKTYTYRDMVAGFIQVSLEGGWRAANTASFQETAKELGIELKFFNAQYNLDNQLVAFSDLIANPEVNVIVLAPLESTGWDKLLRDAKDAEKVVIIVDNPIDAPESLYTTYVGSDFVEEGRKAADAMCRLLEGSAKKNIVELVGNIGASASTDRGIGFREKMGDCGIAITHSETANWTASEGKDVIKTILQEDTDIQGVFGQNDDMALGAIQALKEAGLKPGVDVKLVSIDATRAAFEAMIDGELNATVECNPLMAPQVYEAALMALNGESLPKWIPTIEEVFWAENAVDLIDSRKY